MKLYKDMNGNIWTEEDIDNHDCHNDRDDGCMCTTLSEIDPTALEIQFKEDLDNLCKGNRRKSELFKKYTDLLFLICDL